MKTLLHLLLVFYIFSSNSYAFSLFGYNDWKECHDKNIEKVRLSDAGSVLLNACLEAYSDEDNFKTHKIYKSSGNCIISKVNRLFSFEESLKVINECSKNSETFNYYKKALYFKREVDEEMNRRNTEKAERIRQNNLYESEERIRREILIQQSSPKRIYDSNSNPYKNCYQIGSSIQCN